jgi:hypothetical protein
MAATIRHPANFVSTNYQLASVISDMAINPSNESAATVNAIRAAVQAAAAAFNLRRYPLAVQQYKTAQALCYKLLYPQHHISQYVARDSLMHPVGKQIEQALAVAGLRLIAGIQPDVTPPSPPVRVDGVGPDENGQRLAGLGFQLAAAGAEDRVTLGTSLLAKGQPQEAAGVLREAIEQLRADDSSDAGLQGTALLNLSSALLAQNDTAGAARAATQAARLFGAAQDALGEAQSLHAAGVATQRAGNAAQAEQLLAQASERFASATRQPRTNSTLSGTPATALRGVERRAITIAPVIGRIAIPARVSTPIGATRPAAGLATSLEAAALAATSALADAANSTPSREVIRSALPSTEIDRLDFIAQRDVSQVSLRWPAIDQTWSSIKVDALAQPVAQRYTWQIGIPVGDAVTTVEWQRAQPPAAETLLEAVYAQRVGATTIAGLRWAIDSEATTAAYLAHLYSYAIPVGLGDCYHELGNYDRAEQYYLQAAGYSYINTALEAPALWVKLAQNLLAWGDDHYRHEQIEQARGVYTRLVTAEGGVDEQSPLYSLAAFAGPAQDARAVLQSPEAPPEAANPAIAHLLYTVLARWQYLLGGLDFYGLTFTPIFTFEYLQQVARAFAQQAIQAEREYINFTVQAEAEAATRRDLQSTLAMATIEAQAQNQLAAAAASDAAAADAALRLAQLRASNAAEDRDAYRSAGYWQYISQSIAAAHGAHEDWHGSEIRELARDMEQGSWEGNYGKLAAAATLLGGQKSYEYQLGRMQNQIDEMNATIPIADAQRSAAQSRLRAAQLQAQAANQRRAMVADALNAFENEVFTPELWTRMGLIMRSISNSYQHWAISAAKLMERAYNFETDSQLQVIRPEYSVPSTGDLLGSDLLLRDIDSFTYHFIANVTKKESHLKDVISLRNEYPFQFRDFLRTGRMTFETSLYDFGRRHPGFYGQRLAAVEVQVVGLLPPEGVRGTLRGGIVSRYAQADGSEKTRAHSVDTLALSEYSLRGDAYVFRVDVRELGLFEGHGVATSWELDLPRGSNNLDYRLISDVQLVLYYTARHSQALRDTVVNAPLLPGEDVHVRDFALRYDFPEVWYQFLRTRDASWAIEAAYLPRNEESFRTRSVALALIAPDGTPLDGVTVTLGLPGQAPLTLVTDAAGAISAEGGNALEQAMGGQVLGDWSIQIAPPDGSPLLNPDGSLNAGVLQNIALIVQYQFAYRK